MDGHLFSLSNDKSMSHTGLWEYCMFVKSLRELLKSHAKFVREGLKFISSGHERIHAHLPEP